MFTAGTPIYAVGTLIYAAGRNITSNSIPYILFSTLITAIPTPNITKDTLNFIIGTIDKFLF